MEGNCTGLAQRLMITPSRGDLVRAPCCWGGNSIRLLLRRRTNGWGLILAHTKSKLELARRELRGAVINLDVPDDKLVELRAHARRLFEEVKEPERKAAKEGHLAFSDSQRNPARLARNISSSEGRHGWK